MLIEANQRELIRAKRSLAMPAETVWMLAGRKIIQGDCLATLREMPAGSVYVIRYLFAYTSGRLQHLRGSPAARVLTFVGWERLGGKSFAS